MDGRQTTGLDGTPTAETAARPDASLAERLIAEALALKTEDIPGEAMQAAVRRIVDTVGVGLGGALTPVGQATRRVALADPGDGPGVGVWGSGRRARPESALLANATAAHALDYDDSSLEAIMHTGSLVVPMALAVGEETGASGAELLAAVVRGYQLADYLGQLAFKRFQPHGFQATAVLGIFAAALTGGCLRRLPAATLLDALALCGSLSSGLMEFINSGGDSKPLQVGFATRSALLALDVAAAGATGPATVLEGQYGVFRSFARTEVGPDAPSAKPFWTDFAVSRTVTKLYPVCHAIHGPADAWKEIAGQMRRDGLDPAADVESVTCAMGEFGARFVMEPRERKHRPATAHQARFSLPYCLARIALDGDLDVDSFTAEALADPRAASFARRVSYQALSPEQERTIVASLDVATTRGAYRHDVSRAGRAVDSESWDRLSAKFYRAAKHAGTRDQLDRLLASAGALRGENTIQPFVTALAAVGGNPAR